jgi:hypothetical protein
MKVTEQSKEEATGKRLPGHMFPKKERAGFRMAIFPEHTDSYALEDRLRGSWPCAIIREFLGIR